MTKLLVHKMRAKRFYAVLKDENDVCLFSVYYDLMPNQALPKLAIGEAYCAIQLWLYFLGIVHHPGKQDKD